MKAIYQWVLKTMMKDQTGVMRTLPKKDLVDFNVAMTAERLMRNGFEPNAFKNANQVDNAINQIEAPRNVQQEIKSAKIMDMEGKEIPKGSKIMGGKQAETEAEIAARISKENKEAAERLKQKKLDDYEDDLPMAQGGRAGFKGGLSKAFLEFMKKFKVKQSGDDLKDFLSKRQFMKDMVGNTKANERARELTMLKENLDNYRKRYKGYEFPSDEQIRIDLEKRIQPILNKGRKLNSDGGRAGFKSGLGIKFLKFLNENNPVQAYTKYLKSVKDRVKAGKEAEVAGEVIPIAAGGALLTNQLKKKLKSMNEEQKKELRKDMEKKADGGRIGYKDGPKLSDFIDVQASGSKTGKQQIMGAPEGFTTDEESINAIVKADIPISQKIDLLADYQYGKGRIRVEKDDQELFVDEGGFKNRNIGLGFNKEGEGIGGKIMYNLESGEPQFNIKFKKSFADGGRIGLKNGMDRRTFLKIAGGLAALPFVGKFFRGAKVASKSTPVAKEIIKQSSTPPPYFFELAETIKKFGKPDKVTYQDRVEIHRMVSKDGKSELQLTEDLSTGNIQIKKIKPENDMVNEDIVLEYRKGDVNVDEKTGKAVKEPDEYTEGKEVTQRIYKDDYNEPDFYEGEGIKEIIDEVREAPPIKKAGGGIARMLGE
tara:strand:- start:15 stop:1973 length:1959 start_codon:yes stop_codon:yes gene_type:complete